MIFLWITFCDTSYCVKLEKSTEYIVTRDSWIKHIIAMNSLQVSAGVGISLSILQHQFLIYKSKTNAYRENIYNWTSFVLLIACRTFFFFFYQKKVLCENFLVKDF